MFQQSRNQGLRKPSREEASSSCRVGVLVSSAPVRCRFGVVPATSQSPGGHHCSSASRNQLLHVAVACCSARRPSSPSCNKSSPPLHAVAIDRRRPCLRHHGEIHLLPSTSSLTMHADHASFRYVAMPGLPIYHLLLPVPSRSMQAVMHDWKATYAIGVHIHWPSTVVHRNPMLPAAIIVLSVNARKY